MASIGVLASVREIGVEPFRLDADAAHAIVEEVRGAVRTWRGEAKRLGAKGSEVSLMEAVIDPER